MKKLFTSVALMAILTTVCSSVEEGDTYLIFCKDYYLCQATVEKYSGGKNAKVEITVSAQQLFGGYRYWSVGTRWVSASSLITCSEAKDYEKKHEIDSSVTYKWGSFCN